MKPKEFDDLIRQKFDQNDFAYSPRNWERLAEQMDGRAKKRSMLMWWLMPLAGVAASVALAMGVSPILRQASPLNGINSEVAKNNIINGVHAQKMSPVVIPSANAKVNITNVVKSQHKQVSGTVAVEENDDDVRIDMLNALPVTTKKHKVDINLLNADKVVVKNDKKKNEPETVSTFKPEAEQKMAKTSVILNGGYTEGAQGTGYTAGATIRRMVSDKVYVESDMAFINSNNVQVIGSVYSYTVSTAGSGKSSLPGTFANTQEPGSTPQTSPTNNGNPAGTQIIGTNPGTQVYGGPIAAARMSGGSVVATPATNSSLLNAQIAKGNFINTRASMESVRNTRTSSNFSSTNTGTGRHSGAKTTTTTSGPGNDQNDVKLITDPRVTNDVPYSMNYMQLCPSLGVKLTKKFSLGAGADMEQALADTRPALNPTDNVNEQQAPLFDLGLLAKTEYAVTKKVRAGVYYRKGVNNLFTPDKYIERDYLQFQLKCIIFNK